MPAEQERNFELPIIGGMALPAVLIVSLAAFSQFGGNPHLKSVRPQELQYENARDLKPPYPLNAVYARLWEDPISVSQQHAVENRNKKKESAKDAEDVPADVSEWRNHQKSLVALQEYFRDILTQHTGKKDERRLLLLPVMVSGSPYSEDSETRKRTRYAVVSALGKAGYRLSYPTRVTYVRIPIRVHFAAGPRNEIQELVLPVKLYTPKQQPAHPDNSEKTKYGAVLVCWVNEDQIGADPVDVLDQIAEGLFGEKASSIRQYVDKSWRQRFPELPLKNTADFDDMRGRFDVSVMGPTGSDMLRAMLERPKRPSDAEDHSPFLRGEEPKPRVFVTRATVAQKPSKNGTINDFRDPGSEIDSDQNLFGFTRIIGTDQILGELLAKELRTRSISPSQDENNHIILITERDSLYGATLPSVIRDAISLDVNDNNAAIETERDKLRIKRRIHVITYLRGLDGMTFEKDSSSRDAEEIDRPEGRSQFDYIRRIKDQIADIETTLANGNPRLKFVSRKPSVCAIGVVGTDVYDKLLLLRSLRSHFPSVAFFTTDLDATFSYHQEYSHTRNLIVASHFGLQLHQDLQGDVLPFRGSYQTASFWERCTLLTISTCEML